MSLDLCKHPCYHHHKVMYISNTFQNFLVFPFFCCFVFCGKNTKYEIYTLLTNFEVHSTILLIIGTILSSRYVEFIFLA